MDVVPDWVLTQNWWNLRLPILFKARLCGPSWKWSRGTTWLVRQWFLRVTFVSLLSWFLTGDNWLQVLFRNDGVPRIKGTSYSARSGGVPRNQVRWHLSQHQTWWDLVLEMECRLFFYRWLERARGTQVKSISKDLEVLVQASAHPTVLHVLLFPPVKW